MAVIENYNLPDELYYHNEHAWAKLEDDGSVRVGLDDFFQKEAGDVVYVDLPFEGDEVEQGETCGRVQSSKWIGKLMSSVSGEIIEVNFELDMDSTIINQEPYDDGWILIIEPSNLDEDLANLKHGVEEIEPWIESEIKRAEELREKGATGEE